MPPELVPLTPSQRNHVRVLRGLPLFATFDEPELAVLVRAMNEHRFAPKQIVFREGQVGESCFIVGEGTVAVHKTLSDGRMQFLCEFGPGALFAQVSLVDGGPRSATCIARSPAVLLELTKGVFDRLFHTAHPIAFKFQAVVATILAQQLRQANSSLARISTAVAQGEDLEVMEAARHLTGAHRALEEWDVDLEKVEVVRGEGERDRNPPGRAR